MKVDRENKEYLQEEERERVPDLQISSKRVLRIEHSEIATNGRVCEYKVKLPPVRIELPEITQRQT